MQSDMVELARYVTTLVFYKGSTSSWFIDCRRAKTSFTIKQRGARRVCSGLSEWEESITRGYRGKGSGRCFNTQTHFFRRCEHEYNSLQEMKFHLFENLWSKEPVFFFFPFFSSVFFFAGEWKAALRRSPHICRRFLYEPVLYDNHGMRSGVGDS